MGHGFTACFLYDVDKKLIFAVSLQKVKALVIPCIVSTPQNIFGIRLGQNLL
jgi:hypothetical protein